jgi:hypothetical protein
LFGGVPMRRMPFGTALCWPLVSKAKKA